MDDKKAVEVVTHTDEWKSLNNFNVYKFEMVSKRLDYKLIRLTMNDLNLKM